MKMDYQSDKVFGTKITGFEFLSYCILFLLLISWLINKWESVSTFIFIFFLLIIQFLGKILSFIFSPTVLLIIVIIILYEIRIEIFENKE